ncbi:hypothetical protein [Caldivirga maquilingensis]|uniref:Uncharacterized protein n=1 Tax=Caldivirga maquilingensis (strain ATCC 700844 / DSM 13496 / JCM 10307 / IC-167) TaxID=397948 RepID=A8M9R7_CALMQ|nr:hypothetical protein [Caldivirga maquilingensis]ABW00948.1 hypothetical protein Cmaq_0094 [Caldivirga maquilingensis IC-167]
MKVEFKSEEWGRVIVVNGIEVGRIVDNVISLDIYSPQYPASGERIELGWAGSLVYSRVNMGNHVVEMIGHEHDGLRELISVRVILNGEVNDDELSLIVLNVMRQYMDKELLEMIEQHS